MKQIVAALTLIFVLASCGVPGAPDYPPGASYPGNYPAE